MLRKRLKRLAALKDTTQVAVIKEALDLLEQQMQVSNLPHLKHPGQQILDDFMQTKILEDWEQEIIEKLTGPDI